MLILLTNDDGYLAPGLAALRKALGKNARVITVAPDRDRSGASHSLTVSRPLRVKKIETDFYSVDGTPTDAVMIAVNCITKRKPDMIVSGINSGANMGEDVTYSGTVAAATEGTLLGIPSIAVSLTGSDMGDYSKAAAFAKKAVRAVGKYGLPDGVLLNINVPAEKGIDTRRWTVTRLGKRIYEDVITEKIDPRGNHYYWIAGTVRITGKGPNTDFAAIEKRLISVTPLSIDTTAGDVVATLKSWRF